MDPITHLASGVLGAQAFRKHFPKAQLFTLFCVLAAWIPDIDIFFNRGDPEWSLLYHRAISTSFVGGLGMALILAALYKLFSREMPYWKTTLLAYGLICVHIWLDLITSYGTQLLAPFTDRRFALDATFIIDPLFTVGMLTFILLSLLMRSKSSRFGLWGLVFVFAYPLACMTIGNTLEYVVEKQYARHGFVYDEFEFTPDAFTPFYWKVVTREGDKYSLTLVNTFIPGKEYPVEHGTLADQKLLEKLGKQDSMFTTWSWFARYPAAEVVQNDNGTMVSLRDMRFSSVHPVFAFFFEDDRDRPFTLRADLDDDGNLLRWEFNKATKRFVRQAIE